MTTAYAHEKHYTIKELSAILKISLERTRRLIMDEPGVLRVAMAGKGGRTSGRVMWRIPESVVQRLLRRFANPSRPNYSPTAVGI